MLSFLSNHVVSDDLEWPWRLLQLFATSVNPVSWKCTIWLLLRDYQRILESKDEGLLKVTVGHVRYTCANPKRYEIG